MTKTELDDEKIFVDRNLAQNLERTEGLCNQAFVVSRADLQPASGAAWIEAAGALAMFDGIESPLTQTFGLGVFESVTDQHFDEIEDFFHQRGAAVCHEISPLADVSLLESLNKRGYQPIEMSSVMFRRITADNAFAASSDSKIRTRIIEADEAEVWARTSSAGWSSESPDLAEFILELGRISAESMISFVAEIERQPVATGALFINGDTALLAGASTIPAQRGLGAQTALLQARLRYAAAQNCRIAMMGASPGSQSQRNGEKNNFQIAYTRTKWRLP